MRHEKGSPPCPSFCAAPPRTPAKRRRGSRGGRNRVATNRPRQVDEVEDVEDDGEQPELPERPIEGRIQDPVVAEQALVRKPQIGDSRPAPGAAAPKPSMNGEARTGPSTAKKRRRRGGRGRTGSKAIESLRDDEPIELDDDVRARRRGRERNGRPVGRYLMSVHVRPELTQIAVLEGRSLIEHYVSRPADDAGQIHGNIYLGKVQNVLPGMEAAFVDIGTPKNAVLYRGDVQYDAEDILEKGTNARIEEILRPKQTIVCQVTKNPIGAKGARLTQEVSLPGRFVVLIPNSRTFGISKRLPDNERKRLRTILDRVKPDEHGVIVRTAAEGVVAEELERDVQRLLRQWAQIDALAKRSQAPKLLYRDTAASLSTTKLSMRTCASTWRRSAPSSPTASSTTTPKRSAWPSSSVIMCTSRCTRRSIARSGSPQVAR